jgi:alkyl hydroperoxide reductase subunit D
VHPGPALPAHFIEGQIMDVLASIKEKIPDYAKDIRLNIDGTIARSSLAANDALGVALAAAFATRNKFLVETLKSSADLPDAERDAALTAAALMGMNNVWYPYVEMTGDAQLRTLPAQLRMNAYATHGGVEPKKFEMYALAASIVGKCHFCVASHFEGLKKLGLDLNQLRDIGRIAAVVNAASQVLAAEGVA